MGLLPFQIKLIEFVAENNKLRTTLFLILMALLPFKIKLIHFVVQNNKLTTTLFLILMAFLQLKIKSIYIIEVKNKGKTMMKKILKKESLVLHAPKSEDCIYLPMRYLKMEKYDKYHTLLTNLYSSIPPQIIMSHIFDHH